MPQDSSQNDRLFKPRAERFPIHAPMRYRQQGESEWSDGTTINISRSGVLFRADKELNPATMLEMRIVFPPEITGECASNIICWGPLVRTEAASPQRANPAMAASILRYRLKRATTSLANRRH